MLKPRHTSFMTLAFPSPPIDLYKKMADEGKLGVRLYVMVGEGNRALEGGLAKYAWSTTADGRLPSVPSNA